MPSIQDLLALQQQPQQGGQPGGLVGSLARPQDGWKAQAAAQTGAMNAMPYVLDPNKLSADPAANKALMYPAMLQQGGAPYTPVAGKNMGPDLNAKAPGFDFSNIKSMDDLAKALADKAGVSIEDAKAFIQSQMGGSAAPQPSAAPTAPTAPMDQSMVQTERYNNI